MALWILDHDIYTRTEAYTEIKLGSYVAGVTYQHCKNKFVDVTTFVTSTNCYTNNVAMCYSDNTLSNQHIILCC